jgi:hypothetical protein
MKTTTMFDPADEILKVATKLRDRGVPNRDITAFIFEACAELEKEVNLLEEGDGPGLSQYITKRITGLFTGIGNWGKRKIANVILTKMGLKDGKIKTLILNAIQSIGWSDLQTYAKGTNQEVCATLLTNISHITLTTIIDEVARSETLGIDPNGFIYNMIKEGLMPSDTEAGAQSILKKYLLKEVCPNLSAGFKTWNPLNWFGNRKPQRQPASVVNEDIANINIQEEFQSRMKIRLRRHMKVLLDGGRKDLVKYGKPFSQGRQKHSNAFVAKEHQVKYEY